MVLSRKGATFLVDIEINNYTIFLVENQNITFLSQGITLRLRFRRGFTRTWRYGPSV